MINKLMRFIGLTALLAVMSVSIQAQDRIQRDYDNGQNYNDDYRNTEINYDRFLDVEVWTNHSDGDYFAGDKIEISFRANRDAFVAIYSIDTRGRVNLIFPTEPNENNFIEGGEIYSLPGRHDDFDLVVSGPEGVENIQIIASKDRFPIPDWYPQSGLVCDWEDRWEYADYVNSRYFVKYPGQRFSFDRTSIYVNEWEPDYYRPVYYPTYPSWTVCGNVYVDYPYGATVYIDGVYWGIAPLYIPRIYVGWHTVTIYDHYGYCWENDFHVNRYNTFVMDRSIITPRPNVRSKYKTVREVGYRNPVKHGYPTYKTTSVKKVTTNGDKKVVTRDTYQAPTSKKYSRGATSVVQTKRGYETSAKTYKSDRSTTSSDYNSKRSTKYDNSGTKRSTKYNTSKYKTSTSSKGSSGYYQKKSGTSIEKGKSSSGSKYKVEKRSKSSSPSKSSGSSKKSSGSSKTIKKSSGDSGSKSSAPAKKSSGSSKSKGSKKTKK